MDYKLLYDNREAFSKKFPMLHTIGKVGQSSPPANPWDSGGTYGDGNVTFVKKLIVLHDVKHVIELGCGEGASTRAMLEALDITDGHLYGCDTTNFSQLPHGHKRFHFTQEAGETFVSKFQSEICDLMHIDTSPHNYKQMHYWMFESNCLSKVKVGGFVALHDMGNSWEDKVWGEEGGDTPGQWTDHRGPVKKFVDANEGKWDWTFNPDSNRWGMILLKRLT